jgi:hypothetical protein
MEAACFSEMLVYNQKTAWCKKKAEGGENLLL